MEIKAIIFDIDGTAVPTALEAMPSVRLIQAVKKAQKQVKVCAATGRSLPHARKILHGQKAEWIFMSRIGKQQRGML